MRRRIAIESGKDLICDGVFCPIERPVVLDMGFIGPDRCGGLLQGAGQRCAGIGPKLFDRADFSDALAEIEGLDPNVQPPLAEWVKQATLRIEAVKSIDNLVSTSEASSEYVVAVMTGEG